MQVLENMGVLLRVSDERDKRRNVLNLTTDGKEKCYKILHIHDDWVRKIMEELNDEEQKQFEIYCQRLINAAKRLQEEEKRRESID